MITFTFFANFRKCASFLSILKTLRGLKACALKRLAIPAYRFVILVKYFRLLPNSAISAQIVQIYG
jgi:hypothetical protein